MLVHQRVNIFQIIMISADFPSQQCWKDELREWPSEAYEVPQPSRNLRAHDLRFITGEAVKLTTALGPKTRGSLQRKSCNTRLSILSDWSQRVHSLDKQCQSPRKSDMILRYIWLSQSPWMIQTSIDTYDRKTVHGYLCDCPPFNQSSDHHLYTSSAPGQQSASRVASSQASIHSVKGRPGWRHCRVVAVAAAVVGGGGWCLSQPQRGEKTKTQKRTWNIII